MLASIIINTNNQNQFLNRAILSCLNQNYSHCEIIVADLSKKKDYIIRNKYKKIKKIKFINLKEQFSYPTQNQLFAIKKALKYSKGDYIFFLDGDDYFAENKISFILKKIQNKKFIMDLPIVFNEFNKKKIKKIKINSLKKNIFYKYLINNWPGISCTSGISAKREIVDSFFKKTNPFVWKNLAIDIQISIYVKLKYDIFYVRNNLTYKSENYQNLDKIYKYFFSKKFWIRRKEQHSFNLSINKKVRFKGFDYYITEIITSLLNISNHRLL